MGRVDPIRKGPMNPPKFVTELMRPIAPAAALPLRKVVGSAHGVVS